LAEHLRKLGTEKIGEIRLIASGGGVFEVIVDGRLIYSKKATGVHADPLSLAAQIAAFGTRQSG
jgi:predicted Rdx family selenoprotein